MLKAKFIALRGVMEFIKNSVLEVTKRGRRENFVLSCVKRAYKEQFTKPRNKPPQPPDKLSFF